MKMQILMLLTIISIHLNAQWFSQASGTAALLYDVTFTNSNNGIVVGGNGTILKTTDGGTTWIAKFSGTTNSLRGVSFPDERNGFIVGFNGTILKTINGGETWSLQSSGTTNPLYGVAFADSNNGIAVGGNLSTPSTVLISTNGGITWTSQSSGVTSYLKDVIFSDLHNATAVGSLERIIKTTDGGTNWISQAGGFSGLFNSVSFTDANNGTAVGETGRIRRTTNGGTNWTSQTSGVTYPLLGVHFIDTNRGTVVGNGGRILITINGGGTWTSQLSGITNDLWGVFFIDANNGIAVGSGGTIIKTVNGGGIPVELVSFNAAAINNAVHLSWATATETNNSGFEIERIAHSAKGKAWEKIAFVEGNGTTTETQAYSFIDENIKPGKYSYRLKQIDFDGSFEYSKEVEAEIISPEEFALYQNYPNPFNPSTNLRFRISNFGFVSLKVFDVLGNEIAALVNEVKEPGEYEIEFDAKGLSSGVYFYRLSSGSFNQTNKMILMR